MLYAQFDIEKPILIQAYEWGLRQVTILPPLPTLLQVSPSTESDQEELVIKRQLITRVRVLDNSSNCRRLSESSLWTNTNRDSACMEMFVPPGVTYKTIHSVVQGVPQAKCPSINQCYAIAQHGSESGSSRRMTKLLGINQRCFLSEP